MSAWIAVQRLVVACRTVHGHVRANRLADRPLRSAHALIVDMLCLREGQSS